MSKILVNGEREVLGKISVARAADYSTSPVKVMIQGQLSTHRYLEEIDSLETERYKITGVTVYQESYGSEDFDVIYLFTANKFIVKGGESHLTEREIEIREAELYDHDGGVKQNG